jgi:hypothetical protein
MSSACDSIIAERIRDFESKVLEMISGPNRTEVHRIVENYAVSNFIISEGGCVVVCCAEYHKTHSPP